MENIKTNYKDYTIVLNEKTERWEVPSLPSEPNTVLTFPTLKDAKKAILAEEKKNKVVLKPFKALLIEGYGKKTMRSITVKGYSEVNNGRVYADGLGKDSWGKAKTSTTRTDEIYPDTVQVWKAFKAYNLAQKKQEEAENESERAEKALEKLSLGDLKIKDLLGKK